jgi:hypothetical protein
MQGCRPTPCVLARGTPPAEHDQPRACRLLLTVNPAPTFQLVQATSHGRGRERPCGRPPAQIRASGSRDRAMAHAASGSGGHPTAFDVDLSQRLPWLMSPQAPLRSRTVGFPESGSGLGSARHFLGARSSHAAEGSSDGTHPPSACMVHRPPRSEARAAVNSQLCVWVRAESSEPPSAQSPFARRGRYPRQGGLLDHLGRRYPPFIAHTGSCASPATSHRFRSPLYVESSQVAAIPCWSRDLPDIISVTLVEATGPLPRRVPQVLLPVSSLGTTASRHGKHVRHTGVSLRCDFDREPYFGAADIRFASVSPTR